MRQGSSRERFPLEVEQELNESAKCKIIGEQGLVWGGNRWGVWQRQAWIEYGIGGSEMDIGGPDMLGVSGASQDGTVACWCPSSRAT